MKLLLVVGAVLCAATIVCARPKYFAIPVDDIQFLALEPHSQIRVARQAVYRPAAPQQARYAQEVDPDSSASEGRIARQAGHHGDPHDYVDYGAHTGHHGAFGWYADFPVHTHEH